MSKVVKAVVGVALAVVAPIVGGVIGGVLFGGSAIAATLATAAVTLTGASLVGNALAPEPPDIPNVDAYASGGTKLNNIKSNVNVVPINYGENRLGGNIVWQGTRGTDNSDLHQVIVIGEGPIESFQEYYANSELLTSVGSNGVYHTADGYVQVKGYTTKSGTIYSPSNDSGDITSLSSLFGTWSDSLLPENCAFLVVRQVYNSPNHTGASTITTTIEGEKIKTITSATTISATASYTNNPADIVFHLLTDHLGISEDSIDIAEFYNAKTKCSTYGYTCNISFNQGSNIQSSVKDVLSTFRGQIIFSQGLWKLKLDEKLKTSTKTITDDDILNQSLGISMPGFSEISNKIEVKYINPDDEWLSAVVHKEDTELQSLDAQTLTKTLDIKGITNSAQASKLAEITLNSMRYTEDEIGNRIKQTPISVSFATTIKNGTMEVGDVFTLSHSLLDRDRKFIILSLQSDQSGAIQVTAREYCETHYKNDVDTYII